MDSGWRESSWAYGTGSFQVPFPQTSVLTFIISLARHHHGRLALYPAQQPTSALHQAIGLLSMPSVTSSRYLLTVMPHIKPIRCRTDALVEPRQELGSWLGFEEVSVQTVGTARAKTSVDGPLGDFCAS